MTPPVPPSRAPGPIERLSIPAQWTALLAGSAVFAALLELAAFPAALLLGPMLAGILLALNGGGILASNASAQLRCIPDSIKLNE